MKRGLTIFLAIALMAISIIPFVACDKVEIPEGLNISIMSYNIRQDTTFDTGNKDWRARREYLINHIIEQAPAILCMQEVQKNQAKDIKEALTGYDTIWYSRKTDESEEGLSISYDKEKFELVSKDRFWLSETPSKESKGFGAMFLRICVHAVLKEIETQKEISVYCVHLEVSSEKARNKEIELILERIEDNDEERQVIVCGDFNDTAKSECYKKLAEQLQSTQETAITTEKGISYQDFGGNNLSFDDTIDFIFTSDKFFAVKFDILQEHKEKDGKAIYYSDHYAVKADVILVD